jgi:hypothetical protein
MRIGIDAHIIVRSHKRYDKRIARYTEDLITHLIESDTKKEHTWVLFFDSRMKTTKKFERENVEIKYFPFIHYREFLPVVYSHMLISSYLTAARLDLFHSPEGLIPFMYPGKIITTFHYVPRGKGEAGIFAQTFMLGARVAFKQLCKRASRVIVSSNADKKILAETHAYPVKNIIVMEEDDLNQVDWGRRVQELKKLYAQVSGKKK